MSSTQEKTNLPRNFDPRKFAQKGLELEGQVPLAEMSRVADLISNNQESLEVKLAFEVDDQRTRLIQGRIEGEVELPCQRCLEPMRLALGADLNLAIVWTEEDAKNLPKRLDPLILDEGPTDIYSVIEDEVLLNLPMVAYHDHDCLSKTSFGDEEVEEDLKEEKNPFQILEQLKGSPKS